MSVDSTGATNQTQISEFILLGFGDLQERKVILFLLFLFIYFLTITGNALIVLLVVYDKHFHTPMYFFLGNLSCLETCYSSTLFPRILASFMSGNWTISVNGCFVQLYFVGTFLAVECYLLSVMSCDRYLAICRPLHYSTQMNGRLCLVLVLLSWIYGFLPTTVSIIIVSKMDFCGPNEIDNFFCDSFPILELACSDTHVTKVVFYIVAFVFTFPPLMFTLISYVLIIRAILQIASSTGKQKTFSTCSSHLIVVTVFYGSLGIAYGLPRTDGLRVLNKVFSFAYTMLTPLVNPFIYSLRNKEVKKAILCLLFGRIQI